MRAKKNRRRELERRGGIVSSRRGQFSDIVVIILAIVTLIILVGVLIVIRKLWFEKPIENVDCAAQVKASQTISKYSHGKLASGIKCPTKREIIPADTTNDMVNAAIAEDIKDCWLMWGEGGTLFDKDGTYCHICSFTEFEEDSGDVPGLFEYLSGVRAPGSAKSYLDFLQPSQSKGRYQGLDKKASSFSLSKEKAYAVIFYYARGHKAVDLFFTTISEDELARAGTGAQGFAIGAVGGAAVAGMLCVAVTGGLCGIPMAITAVAFGTVGAAGGYTFGGIPPEYVSMIMVREMSEESIANLGCEYSFVERG